MRDLGEGKGVETDSGPRARRFGIRAFSHGRTIGGTQPSSPARHSIDAIKGDRALHQHAVGPELGPRGLEPRTSPLSGMCFGLRFSIRHRYGVIVERLSEDEV